MNKPYTIEDAGNMKFATMKFADNVFSYSKRDFGYGSPGYLVINGKEVASGEFVGYYPNGYYMFRDYKGVVSLVVNNKIVATGKRIYPVCENENKGGKVGNGLFEDNGNDEILDIYDPNGFIIKNNVPDNNFGICRCISSHRQTCFNFIGSDLVLYCNLCYLPIEKNNLDHNEK